MAASNADKFRKVGKPGTATTLSAPGHTSGGTSITVGSTTNWPTDTGVTFAIDRVTVSGSTEVQVAGSYTVWRGTVATGTTITNMVLDEDSPNSDQDYPAGSTTRVYIPVSAGNHNDLVDGILVDHEQTGSHKTLTDSNGNEWLERGVTASAVNHVKVTNSSTGNSPTIESAGSDTNVGLILDTKGTGSLDLRANWQGYITNVSQVPTSVTNNGNGSYTLTGASNWSTWWAAGMKGRATRTVSAPTSSFSLDGTNDFYNDTTVSGMTFTDDFCAGAWVYLRSYAAATIMSRYNGTSGWVFQINASGQLQLLGLNSGSANFRGATTTQSLPLNKWVHVAMQIDMSTHTASPTTHYAMFNGVDVPVSTSQGGTNPTSLIQAGNLEIGSQNSGIAPWPGEIDQVFVSSAKITQANMRTIMTQAITASTVSTHSIVSAYSGGSTTDINTTNANNLTAQNGATTTVRSPFATNSDGTETATLDYFLVMNVNGTSMTVQVPEGCTLSTSGGISALDIGIGNPYGFPMDKDRWSVDLWIVSSVVQAAVTAATVYNPGGLGITAPVGDFMGEMEITVQGTGTTSADKDIIVQLSTSNSSISAGQEALSKLYFFNTVFVIRTTLTSSPFRLRQSSATFYYLNYMFSGSGTLTNLGNSNAAISTIRLIPAGI